MGEDETLYLKDKKLLKKSLIVLGGVIGLFVVHGSLQIEPSVIALGGVQSCLSSRGQVLKECFMKLTGLLYYFSLGFS